MKTPGIVGGIAPESTIEYYRFLIAAWRTATNDGSYPPLLINSIDLTRMIGGIAANEYERVTDELSAELQKLARAGADFGLFASNTPHLLFDELRRRSPIPLISIVEVARDAATAAGYRRLGLFGTRFTMRGGFYQDVFGRAGMSVIAPRDDEQELIHAKYMGELVNGILLPETRAQLVAIAREMHSRDSIDALILGGTELPLILRDAADVGVPMLDTTRIHVDAIVKEMLA